MDVTSAASVKEGVNAVLQKEGRIDILINNAGMGISGAIEDFTTEEAKLQMDTQFLWYVSGYSGCFTFNETTSYRVQ